MSCPYEREAIGWGIVDLPGAVALKVALPPPGVINCHRLFSEGWWLVSPSLLHSRMLTGLILCRYYITHSCWVAFSLDQHLSNSLGS